MKRTIKILTLAVFSGIMLFISCNKDDSKDSGDTTLVKGTATINASAYDKWVYFSFANNDTVKIDDYTTSLNWDLGFHRQDIRVNCGKSGIGEGGTFDFGKVDFESVTSAPESGYSLNDSIQILEAFVMPPVYVTVPGDTLLAKWLLVEYVGGDREYNYNDHIYVVKTANGKYAKIWFKNYFSDESVSGYITMKYNYQSDSTTVLE